MMMKQRMLGTGGPLVSAVGLGCMSFAGFFGPTTPEESLRCLDQAWDSGINFLDTSNVYGMGRSEEVIGAWLASRRHKVHIATKAGIVTKPTRHFDNSEAHLRGELEASLRRLGVDHVALFYVHRREAARPVEEVVETLSRLIDEGKILGYGLSEVSPGTLRRAHAVHPCRAVQNEYSLWTRLPELGMIQACAELGVAFVPFSPLGRGIFSAQIPDPTQLAEGDFRRSIPRFQEPDWSLNRRRIAGFQDFARARGVTASALALAWILDQAPHLIPIPGTRTAAHLAEWAGAGDITLSAEDRSAIDRLLPIGWAHGDRYGADSAATVERYC
jgi:aryl-alcohol dehydrogenase-like predicted oxidoreductase